MAIFNLGVEEFIILGVLGLGIAGAIVAGILVAGSREKKDEDD